MEYCLGSTADILEGDNCYYSSVDCHKYSFFDLSRNYRLSQKAAPLYFCNNYALPKVVKIELGSTKIF